MSTQNPVFSFFTTYPGGTPLKNPDTTQSKGIEMGADGPPGNPLEITDTHNGTLKVLTPAGSVYNPSGRYLLQVLNLLDGKHTFGLRPNSSSAPLHEWELTVGGTPASGQENFLMHPEFHLQKQGESQQSRNGLLITLVRERSGMAYSINLNSLGLCTYQDARGQIKFNGHAQRVILKCNKGGGWSPPQPLTFIVDYYDFAGQLVVSQTHTLTAPMTVDFTAPSGRNLHYIEIDVPVQFEYLVLTEATWL